MNINHYRHYNPNIFKVVQTSEKHLGMKFFFFVTMVSLFAAPLAHAQAPLETLTGSRIECLNQVADVHPCHDIDLLSRVSMSDLDPDAWLMNDIWGWTDPETQRDYALVGTSGSVVFIDVTDPVNPVHLGKLSGRNGEYTWRDMKVYHGHMFVVVDGHDNGMQIFDLRQLRSDEANATTQWTETAFYDAINTAHNIAINEETGFAYITGYTLSNESEQGRLDLCRGSGLHIVDIRDPSHPVYAGCAVDLSTGDKNNGYTHDAQCLIYRGPDIRYQGREICIGSNETHISIIDVTDKMNPQILSAATYPFVGYSHQGWLTHDHRYFLMNDEQDELNPAVDRTRTIIWDLEDLEDPVYDSSFFFSTNSVDHNLYVYGDYMFASNYTSGLRIVDVSEIDHPQEIAFFDTHPYPDQGRFNGAWSLFRFPDSGTTIVSSHPYGLFVLDPQQITITDIETSLAVPEVFSLTSAYPNPFNPTTSATLSLAQPTHVHIEVLNTLGRSVRTIHDGLLSAGEHLLSFDATNLPSGSYEIRVSSDRYTTGTRVVLIK
ncbi:MAG: choice-of-anchor B family protein [Bacteroidetes bacterium]|nr:choice-of-anchor B family protein [Bacteroidota bacterium]